PLGIAIIAACSAPASRSAPKPASFDRSGDPHPPARRKLDLDHASRRARRRGRQNGFRRNRNRGKAGSLASAMPGVCARQNAGPRLPAPRVQLIGGNIVPPRDLADHCVGRLAFLDDPQLLSRRPAPAPLGTGKDCHRHRVCPLTPKSMGQRSHARRRFGRWPSPDAYPARRSDPGKSLMIALWGPLTSALSCVGTTLANCVKNAFGFWTACWRKYSTSPPPPPLAMRLRWLSRVSAPFVCSACLPGGPIPGLPGTFRENAPRLPTVLVPLLLTKASRMPTDMEFHERRNEKIRVIVPFAHVECQGDARHRASVAQEPRTQPVIKKGVGGSLIDQQLGNPLSIFDGAN